MVRYSFPDSFLWGSATSAFQVEGECKNHDFYDWALKGKIIDNTNPYDAVFHYRNYKDDIKLLKEMNHNAARIGLEWARIEPKEGFFDENALNHYSDELSIMKNEGISTMVTLHHFSNPIWFSNKGGWENPKSTDYFLRYVKHAVEYLGVLIDFYITINEPTVLAHQSYFQGNFPPGKKSFMKMVKVNNLLAKAHISAYDLIHSIHESNSWNKARVGVAKHMRNFDPYNSNSFKDRFSTYIVNAFFNYSFLNRIMNTAGSSKGKLDYFGLNYYSGDMVKFPLKSYEHDGLTKNSLGWSIFPEGFYRILKEIWEKYRLPIYVTENGVCDDNDELREDYLKEHLKSIHKAVKEGVDIRGYYYWSTMDNFELVNGLSIRFGLIHVDHQSLERTRTIKKSGRFYADIIKNNGFVE